MKEWQGALTSLSEKYKPCFSFNFSGLIDRPVVSQDTGS
jgi:hypothetical protein